MVNIKQIRSDIAGPLLFQGVNSVQRSTNLYYLNETLTIQRTTTGTSLVVSNNSIFNAGHPPLKVFDGDRTISIGYGVQFADAGFYMDGGILFIHTNTNGTAGGVYTTTDHHIYGDVIIGNAKNVIADGGRLDINASTATQAHIRLRAGVANGTITTPKAGMINYDGTDLWLYSNSNWQKLNGGGGGTSIVGANEVAYGAPSTGNIVSSPNFQFFDNVNSFSNRSILSVAQLTIGNAPGDNYIQANPGYSLISILKPVG